MSWLVINGKHQSVTTMVTYHGIDGQQHILLGRSDPRYRDTKGECLNGGKLAVGPCQFIGGQVEDNPEMFPLIAIQEQYQHFNRLPDVVDPRIAAAALKELGEEISLDVSKHVTDQTHLSLVETLTRESGQMGQS